MGIFYNTPLPYPEGSRRGQLYKWARQIATWFEHWTSAHMTTAVNTVDVFPNYTLSARWVSAYATGGIIYAMVYKEGQPFNYAPLTIVEGDGINGLAGIAIGANAPAVYLSNHYGIFVPQYYSMSSMCRFAKAATPWSSYAQVLGPYGLFASVKIGVE